MLFNVISCPALKVIRMSICVEGKLIFPRDQLNLDLTLLGGQSFRWKKQTIDENDHKWRGVAFNCFWDLSQTSNMISYKAFCSTTHTEDYFNEILKKYFRLNFDLKSNCKTWKSAHAHFADTSDKLKAVRLLDQDPLETIIAFICSQNNHIKRISSMVEWLCSKYGDKICTYENEEYFTFPSLKSLHDHRDELESVLRTAKFGYRAKFISGCVTKINEFGGIDWFNKLKEMPYKKARLELKSLPGIGFKVADCICLMALCHLESVPIDTHIYKIAQNSYLPDLGSVKTLTPKVYENIADHFREVYGEYAGWAQAVLFCSSLQKFQNTEESPLPRKKKKK